MQTSELEYKNINKKSLIYGLNRENHFATKNTLQTYKNAVYSAESINYPNRYFLLEIYNDIIKDTHLQSVLSHRKKRISGLEYSIIKSNGKPDTKLTSLFNEEWFSSFLELTLDAIFWGNSLIEILNNKGFIECVLIPRENVIPEFQQIKINPVSNIGDIDYSANTYKNTLVDVNSYNNKRCLGEFLEVSKLILFKNEVLLNWSQFIELFGQPIRVATTDSQDPQEINDIFNYLKQLGRSGYVVKNSQTQIDFVNADSKGDAGNLFNSYENYLNEEVSKRILGGTMITDSGSSRSQSEVHERSSYLYTKSDIKFVTNIVNNQLIPILKEQGLINKQFIEFKFDEPEILTIDEKIKVDTFLLNNFNLTDIEYFEKRYGTALSWKDKSQINSDINTLDNKNAR